MPDAAAAGDTIELLTDVTATEVILIDKSLTINGNGHKIVCAEGVTVTNNGTLNDVIVEEPAPAVEEPKEVVPEFSDKDLDKAIISYSKRTRRFGKTDEQL